MPASRILEGSLPEQQPKGPDFFWRPTTTQNGARAGYQGQSPWLVSTRRWEPRKYGTANVFMQHPRRRPQLATCDKSGISRAKALA